MYRTDRYYQTEWYIEQIDRSESCQINRSKTKRSKDQNLVRPRRRERRHLLQRSGQQLLGRLWRRGRWHLVRRHWRRHGAVSLAIFSEKCRLNSANIERFTSECVLGIPRIILISIPTTRTDTVSHASVACRRGTSASRFRTNFGAEPPTRILGPRLEHPHLAHPHMVVPPRPLRAPKAPKGPHDNHDSSG